MVKKEKRKFSWKKLGYGAAAVGVGACLLGAGVAIGDDKSEVEQAKADHLVTKEYLAGNLTIIKDLKAEMSGLVEPVNATETEEYLALEKDFDALKAEPAFLKMSLEVELKDLAVAKLDSKDVLKAVRDALEVENVTASYKEIELDFDASEEDDVEYKGLNKNDFEDEDYAIEDAEGRVKPFVEAKGRDVEDKKFDDNYFWAVFEKDGEDFEFVKVVKA